MAALSSLLLTWLLARFAHRLGMIDHPGGHKHHAQPIPMVGGAAIAATIGLLLALDSAALSSVQWTLLIALLAMLLVGIADDRLRLAPSTRLLAQAAVALYLAWMGDGELRDLGRLIDGEHLLRLAWFSLPLTVFSVVGVINACNMSDGIDGAAGGMVLLALAGALLLADGHAPWVHMPIIAITLGAVFGFLMWNMPLLRSARAYLGDGGSLLLGTLLAWVVVNFSQGPERAFAPVAALWLYAVPLIDTVSVMWRRAAEGRSPFQPDQRHLHHMLLRAGVGVRNAWLILMCAALLGVSLAIIATRASWPEPLLALAFLSIAFAHHFVMRHADRSGRWFGHALATDVASAARTNVEPSR